MTEKLSASGGGAKTSSTIATLYVERQTDRQTDKQDGQTDRQTRRTDRHVDRSLSAAER